MGHQKWCNTVALALIFIVLPLNVYLLCQTSLHVSVKMLVQVKYSQQQKYVKLDEDEGRFDFMQFHENVIERFCLPPDAKVIYKDATGTEVDAEIFSDLVGQGNVVLTLFSDQEFSDFSLSSASETSDSSFSSSASTIILDDVPSKRQRIEDTHDAVSAEQEHFYDAASSTGYISWRLKTVQRKIRRGSELPPNSPIDFSPGGPNFQRTVNAERQLDGDACQEAMSLLNHTTDNSLIFQKMRETFQHRQKLVNDPGRSVDILSSFPRFLDTKGLVDQDFTLLFDGDTSSRLLQKWDLFFKPNVIKEAKRLTSTPELRRLVQSAESLPGSDLDEPTTYDQEMASLLLLLHLLPPPPGGLKSPKISACDAVERLVVFHKSCCSLEEHLRNQQGQQPYLLAVGRQKSKIESYITMDKRLIPCKANRLIH
ncbi:uncharacterized protein LOC115180226 isoform X3 [Salmo trutta]|uniref:uncharacterized protein LOC115180226 isoform X3 n=1 Tax=Salmo trutta TaxID=8032 RepID=UPI0011327A9B|nr:uncharacterized protein LOC115180226 isoform X3 [Salmo trutta]